MSVFQKIRIHLPPLNLERLKEAYIWSQNQALRMFGSTGLIQEQSAPEGDPGRPSTACGA